jgi:hypothetical protein
MMKTIAATMLALTMGSTTFAQGPGDRGGTPPTPEQMVERRVQMLTTLLTLDSTQQQQAKTIFTDEATASQALRESTKAAHDALQAAVKAGASDGQIDQLAAQIGSVTGQGAAIHAKAQSKFRAILNSAQKEKLDTREGMRGPSPGGPGGFGSRPPRF